MSDADEAFGPFPCRSAHEVDHAIFRGDPVDLGPRVRDRRARCHRRDDTRFIAAGLLVVERRPQSDDALAATGAVSAVGEVQLAAAAAYLMGTGRFRRYLAEEVDVDAVIDGNEIIHLRNDERIIDDVYRISCQEGVVVHPVIEVLRPQGEGPAYLIAAESLAAVRELAVFIHESEGVDEHFRMDAQVFQVRFGQ